MLLALRVLWVLPAQLEVSALLVPLGWSGPLEPTVLLEMSALLVPTVLLEVSALLVPLGRSALLVQLG